MKYTRTVDYIDFDSFKKRENSKNKVVDESSYIKKINPNKIDVENGVSEVVGIILNKDKEYREGLLNWDCGSCNFVDVYDFLEQYKNLLPDICRELANLGLCYFVPSTEGYGLLIVKKDEFNKNVECESVFYSDEFEKGEKFPIDVNNYYKKGFNIYRYNELYRYENDKITTKGYLATFKKLTI